MQAMGLSGTYEKLDQLTKMQVNYNAILAQSPDAIGDCERSLGSYKSTVVQFQSKLKEIKTLVGQFFMPTFQKVISFGAKGLTVLRDGVQKLNDFAAKIGGAEKIIGVLGVTIGGHARHRQLPENLQRPQADRERAQQRQPEGIRHRSRRAHAGPHRAGLHRLHEWGQQRDRRSL